MEQAEIIDKLNILFKEFGYTKKGVEVSLNLSENSLSRMLAKGIIPLKHHHKFVQLIESVLLNKGVKKDCSCEVLEKENKELKKELAELKIDYDKAIDKISELLPIKNREKGSMDMGSLNIPSNIKNEAAKVNNNKTHKWDGVSIIDFGDDKILNKENYTLYPKEYALKGFEKTEYYNLKKISDAIIVTQWDEHKKSIL